MLTLDQVDQFWLLTGEVPTGPFTVAQIHAELAAGRATWQTSACLVGGNSWQPLIQTPGLGPVADEKVLEDLVVVTPSPSENQSDVPAITSEPAPTTAPPATDPNEQLIMIAIWFIAIVLGIGLLSGAGYGLYEWLRPLTPTEVCQRMHDAETVTLKPREYVTARMWPFMDDVLTDSSEDTDSEVDIPVEILNDEFVLTNEDDGPDNSKRVGFRGSSFVEEAGRRVDMEGYLKVVEYDGWICWKVDDIIITGVDGASLPSPLSSIDEYNQSKAASKVEASKPEANKNLKHEEIKVDPLGMMESIESIGVILFRPWVWPVISGFVYFMIVGVLYSKVSDKNK